MPATVIAERIGWTRGITVLKERVAELRPACLPPDPASRTLVWDGEGAVGRSRAGKTELTQECQVFRRTLETKVIVLKPREPEHEAIIERAHDYLERRSCPAAPSLAQLTSTPNCSSGSRWSTPADAGCSAAPRRRIAADKAAMLPLPPIAPATGCRAGGPPGVVRRPVHDLYPGDVINTGTLAGVAMNRADGRYLRAGDVVTLEIDGLGRQQQTLGGGLTWASWTA